MGDFDLPSKEHFQCDFEISEAMDTYYSEVLASKEEGFSSAGLQPYIERVESKKLNIFFETILEFIVKIHLFSGDFGKKLNNLLVTNEEAGALLKLHQTASKYSYQKGEIPYVFLDERILKVASQLKVKSIKYQKAIRSLGVLELERFDSKPELLESVYRALPGKIKKTIDSILLLQGLTPDSEQGRNLVRVLQEIEKMTDSNGKNVLQQISQLFVEKRGYLDDLSLLCILQEQPKEAAYQQFVAQLSNEMQKKLNSDGLVGAVAYAQQKLADIKKIFNLVLEEADGKLSVYEASTDRLAQKFGKDVLNKPITVTMCGVEYAGLVKEGGLAEALEGLAQGLLKQHPDNKVRLIFPKFTLLPQPILEKLKAALPETYIDHAGDSFSVFRQEINGVEVLFIDHPSFAITGPKPSIYTGTQEEMKMRFATFSSLAADLLCQLPKSDVIHLHDWHVAGVGLKLRNLGKEIAPIVFTYHNNQRAAQGRYFNEVYNYEPLIQHLRSTGIASENVNLMVDAVKKADAVTTVSNTFAIESQSIARGEGVSFAMREAAREGKLSGIVNGVSLSRWDPETDSVLKNWKRLDTKEPLDLTYSATSEHILEKKALCRQQLQQWVHQEFPHITFDCSKPIVTYVGRYDYYQKGLDKFEEAIEATLRNGGQFICMGTAEDPEAAKVLDRIQRKYPDGVLVIRDYKTAQGYLHYQEGMQGKPGAGSLIRAATDFVFVPSTFEPCGLVQFESWLFGSQVIASNVGGLADTVISPNQSEKNYNGYLFKREAETGRSSLSATIENALGKWLNESPESKQKVMSRLMLAGKKYGWNEAPFGYSPVEKYRFVYENARQMALGRMASVETAGKQFDIQRYRRLLYILEKSPERKSMRLEEKYLEAYYKQDIPKLKKLYKLLPRAVKAQFPAPYAIGANFAEYKKLGAHYSPESTTFQVHAPSATKIHLQLFDKEGAPKDPPCEMRLLGNGIWNINLKGIAPGTQYQYIIDGQPKIDPYGIQTTPVRGAREVPRSVVAARDFEWHDETWMKQRAYHSNKQPVSIYELHPASWQTREGKSLNYRELAEKIVTHCKETGYTHVELMGILEHPFERSYGYQVSNFFSPNSRMGTMGGL